MARDRLPPFLPGLPVFAASIFMVSGSGLVIAACKAGIVGAFPSPNARRVSVLDEWLARITLEPEVHRTVHPAAMAGPLCVNLVNHSSNARLEEKLRLVARHRPPILVSALGSPRRAIAAGADGLACVSAGAGGHAGQLSPFAFVRAVRAFFDGPVAVGGGIADGWSLAGAIAVVVDRMGTKFRAALARIGGIA